MARSRIRNFAEFNQNCGEA